MAEGGKLSSGEFVLHMHLAHVAGMDASQDLDGRGASHAPASARRRDNSSTLCTTALLCLQPRVPPGAKAPLKRGLSLCFKHAGLASRLRCCTRGLSNVRTLLLPFLSCEPS